jgi:hypothetical protein
MATMGKKENDNETNQAMQKNDENRTRQAVVMDADRPAKRLSVERMSSNRRRRRRHYLGPSTTRRWGKVVLGESLLSLGYLEPFDLIRLLHVCKAARLATVQKLKSLILPS